MSSIRYATKQTKCCSLAELKSLQSVPQISCLDNRAIMVLQLFIHHKQMFPKHFCFTYYVSWWEWSHALEVYSCGLTVKFKGSLE